MKAATTHQHPRKTEPNIADADAAMRHAARRSHKRAARFSINFVRQGFALARPSYLTLNLALLLSILVGHGGSLNRFPDQKHLHSKIEQTQRA